MKNQKGMNISGGIKDIKIENPIGKQIISEWENLQKEMDNFFIDSITNLNQ
jgi:hypothetical protein